MDQVWKGDVVVPVTVVAVEPNTVGIIRTKERDGYDAVQLKNGKKTVEFRSKGQVKVEIGEVKSGDQVSVSVFEEGDIVKISGLNKGRGFQGVVKRHNFGGGPKTHGQKNRHRAPGSIGSTAFQRVVPGRRMAGHMGQERVTMKNVEVVAIDAEKNLMLLKGAVPGMKGTMIEIARIGKKK
jgi:large subunit ribosomal protein L3